METVNDRIRQRFLALARGRSVRAFALQSSLDPAGFLEYLKDREPGKHLAAVAEALECPWQWLLIGDEGYEAIKKWKDDELASPPAGQPRARRRG